MSCLLYQVDAFANAAFSGNPAAVCILPSERRDAWLQSVAEEMNLSETAFVRPTPGDAYSLRWFTPTHEVSLCGHATLASAHILWTEGMLAHNVPALFETASGTLVAGRDGNWINMDFPSDPPSPTDAPPALLDGLGGEDPVYTGLTGRDYFVHLSEADAVRSMDPDLTALSSLDTRGTIVTAAADPNESADFVSRFFAPGVGVPEDPVTGSAHCALGPYWAVRLGRTSLTGRQCSPRGGSVRLELERADSKRIELAGQATTVVRGRLDTDDPK